MSDVFDAVPVVVIAIVVVDVGVVVVVVVDDVRFKVVVVVDLHFKVVDFQSVALTEVSFRRWWQNIPAVRVLWCVQRC